MLVQGTLIFNMDDSSYTLSIYGEILVASSYSSTLFLSFMYISFHEGKKIPYHNHSFLVILPNILLKSLLTLNMQ